MLDPAIQDFLNERKELWLKKKIKTQNTEEENASFEREAEDIFTLSNWLPDAAKRAKQLSLVSHPAKFTHSSARSTPIIVEATKNNDGYLRSGNAKVGLDITGNAGAMDVYTFLTLELQDGKSILSHLENNSEVIRQQLKFINANYDDLVSGLLAIKFSKEKTNQTSGYIKQVYFPIDLEHKNYHLLSVLTASTIMFELKKRVNAIRFSPELKEARKARREGKAWDESYSEIYNLTAIGFGGTKPRVVSIQNHKNYGTGLLLESLPPQLDKRRVNPPHSSFADKKYLNPKYYLDDFNKLFSLILKDNNNKQIRNNIQWQCKAIFYQLIDRSWEVRRLPEGWSDSERYEKLPHAQKVWLDKQYIQTRGENAEWLDSIKKELVRWFMNAYNELLDSPKSIVKDGDKYKIRDYEFLALMDWLDDCEAGLL